MKKSKPRRTRFAPRVVFDAVAWQMRVTVGAALGLLPVACGARTALVIDPMDGALARAPLNGEPSDARAAVDTPAPLDASVDSAVTLGCPNASDTRVYLFTEQGELYSFYPPSLAYEKIGEITCPNETSIPYSMGVSRDGLAYALFLSGHLFQLSTVNAACSVTPYVPNQHGWATFGMGYASQPDGGEALYVTEANFQTPSKGLGTIDTATFELQFIHAYGSTLPRCELTGTGDGRLFAFCLNLVGAGSVLAQIDPSNANVLAADSLPIGKRDNSFAVAFWGGAFWIFTGTSNETTVTKYDLLTKSMTTVTTLTGSVVGAGVSTCAPL